MASRTRKRQVQIVVDVKSAKAIRAIKKLAKENKEGFGSIGEAIKKSTGSFKKHKDSIVALNAALQIFRRLLDSTVGLLGRMVGEAREQNRVLADLASTLDRAGIGWAENSDRALEFASTLQRTAGIADNETQRTMQLVSAMGRGVMDSFDDITNATEFVINAAAQTGQGVDSLGRIAARVANRDVAALSRSLPGLAAQLEIMKEAGATGSEMLSFMAEQMRGVAAEGDTMHIQLSRLAASYGDVREAVGQIVLGALEASGAVDSLAGSFDSLAEAIADPTTQAGMFVRDGLSGVIAFGNFAIQVIGRLALGFNMLKSALDVAAARFAQEMLERERAAAGFAGRIHEFIRDAMADELEALQARIREAGGARAVEGGLFGGAILRREREMREALADQGGRVDDLSLRYDALGDVIEGAERETRGLIAQFENMTLAGDDALRTVAEQARAIRDALSFEFDPSDLGGERGAGGADPGGGGGGDDDEPDPREAARLMWLEAVAEQKAGALAGLIATGDAFEEWLTSRAGELNELLSSAGEDAGMSLGEGIVAGMDIATQALQGFAQTIPRIMEGGAQDGADRIAAVFQFMGQAAQIAAAVGVAAKASTSWLGPLSQFFAMAAAAASFAGAMGAGGGGGGGSTGAGARGATGAEAADVLVGQRPEATRGGITRNISINAGYVLNNTETRRELGSIIMEAQELNEIRGVA